MLINDESYQMECRLGTTLLNGVQALTQLRNTAQEMWKLLQLCRGMGKSFCSAAQNLIYYT